MHWKAVAAEALPAQWYVDKARIVWERMRGAADDPVFQQTHDGYMKVFQLAGPDLGPRSPWRPACWLGSG